MARILCVLPYLPVPADSGGKLRTLRLLEALDARHDVTVLAAAAPGADAGALRARLRGSVFAVGRGPLHHVRDLAAVAAGHPLRYARYGGAAMRDALEDLLSRRGFDAIHLDHLHTAPLLPVLRGRLPGVPVILDEHNVESTLVARVAERERGPRGRLLALQARAVERLERDAVAAADAVLCCSGTDAAALRAMGARRVEVVPNGTDFRARPPAGERRGQDLVFVGALDWQPNVVAALELGREIWPAIARRAPEARLVLVGRNPPREVRRLASHDVFVTGTVPSVEPYLASAFASAMPLRAGSGTRLKILEAAAAGVPLVATALAAEGLPFEHDRELLLAETPAEFAGAVVRLFREPALGYRLATLAAERAASFAWPVVAEGLLRLYDGFLASGAARRAWTEAPAAAGACSGALSV